jgi:hypothetical protein
VSWITKPGEREQRQHEVITIATRAAITDILNARLWLPIYEVGGIDALIEAGEISRNPLPERNPAIYLK